MLVGDRSLIKNEPRLLTLDEEVKVSRVAGGQASGSFTVTGNGRALTGLSLVRASGPGLTQTNQT